MNRSILQRLSFLWPRNAGIDVGNGAHYVAVRPDHDQEAVRWVRVLHSRSPSISRLVAELGVKTVALQSTGVYSIPLYDILEERGFEVYLLTKGQISFCS